MIRLHQLPVHVRLDPNAKCRRICRLEPERARLHWAARSAHRIGCPHLRLFLLARRFLAVPRPIPIGQPERAVVQHTLQVQLQLQQHEAMPRTKHRPAVRRVLRVPRRRVDDEVAQALFERPGQDGQQQLVLLRLPVDVEPVRELRLPAPVEHRPQLPVERFRGGPGHVVGHHVDDQPQVVPVELGRHLAVRGLPAEVGRDQRMVDDVVAVRRTGVGLQDRRQVDVRHTQRGQVAGLLGRPAEPEAVPELQPVGGHGMLAAGERAAGVPACGLSHGAATARSG